MKKVYFVYQTTLQPYGGVNSFNRALAKEMEGMPDEGFFPTDDWRQADLIFLSAASRGPDASGRDRTLRLWQLHNLLERRALNHPLGILCHGSESIPMVHRLDGLTARYGRKDGAGYDRLQIELNRLAKRTVFQSHYSMESFREGSPRTQDTVIMNGVDGALFTWQARSLPEHRVRYLAVSFSSNLRKGHAAYAALSKLPHVEVSFAGRWAESIPLGNVRLLPPMPQTDLVKQYYAADCLVHFAENDNAPNVVVEALATGLPVLYLDSGGTGEIVGNRYGVGIAELDTTSLQRGSDTLRAGLKDFQKNVSENRSDFLISASYKRYATIFRSVV